MKGHEASRRRRLIPPLPLPDPWELMPEGVAGEGEEEHEFASLEVKTRTRLLIRRAAGSFLPRRASVGASLEAEPETGTGAPLLSRYTNRGLGKRVDTYF